MESSLVAVPEPLQVVRKSSVQFVWILAELEEARGDGDDLPGMLVLQFAWGSEGIEIRRRAGFL